MTLPDFLREKSSEEEQHECQRQEYQNKCFQLLKELKEINKSRFKELNTTYHEKYRGDNVKTTMLVGFYGQLVNELKNLRPGTAIPTPAAASTPKISKPKAAPTVKKTEPKKIEEKQEPKKEAKKIEDKKVEKAKPEAKTAKKAPAKKTTTKKTAAKKAPAKSKTSKKSSKGKK